MTGDAVATLRCDCSVYRRRAVELLARSPVANHGEQVVCSDDAVLVYISSAAITYTPTVNHSQNIVYADHSISIDIFLAFDCIATWNQGCNLSDW